MITNSVQKNNFKFFVPLEITKGKDKEGKETMRIGGIASTLDRDTDGEVLDPAGFQLDYFLKNGFINWHHQSKTNPTAIIGEPTKAEIKKEGLYIEGELYKDSKVAQSVYDLAKTLEKSKSGRRLGFSIEGKVVKRDELDERFVKEAIITGVAVTPSPKNASTILDILKGNFTDNEEEPEIVSTEKTANGGTIEYIVDVMKQDGSRITVDKSYNVKVVAKGMDTSNAAATIRADVEGQPKKIAENAKGKKKNSNFESLTKSEIFFEVLKYTDDLEKAKQTTINLYNKNLNPEIMKTDKLSKDEIIKALTDVGVAITEDQLKKADEIVKAKNDDDDDDKKKKEKEAEDLKKAKDAEAEKKKKEEEDLKKAKEEEEEKKKKKDADDMQKGKYAYNEDDEDSMKKAEADMEKGLADLKEKIAKKKKISKNDDNDADDMKKAIVEDITKANEASNNAILAKLEEMSKANESNLEIIKGLQEKVDKFENGTNGRKSVTTTKFLEKSFGENELKNKTQMSITKDKVRLGNILMAKAGLEKGENNEFYSNAALELESMGTLSKSVISDLNINHNIVLTE